MGIAGARAIVTTYHGALGEIGNEFRLRLALPFDKRFVKERALRTVGDWSCDTSMVVVGRYSRKKSLDQRLPNSVRWREWIGGCSRHGDKKISKISITYWSRLVRCTRANALRPLAHTRARPPKPPSISGSRPAGCPKSWIAI